MKNLLGSIVLATSTFCSLGLLAQVQSPTGTPPPPPPAGAPAPPPIGPAGPVRPGGPADRPLMQVSAFSGMIGSWVSNDDFIVDGFYLDSASQKKLVKFPAHLATQLKDLKGSVTVNGVQETNPEGVSFIHLVSLATGSKTITDTPPAAPVTPPSEQSISGSAKIEQIQKDPAGRVKGYVLQNKVVLKVPPHVGDQLATIGTVGANVGYSGVKRSLRNGELSSADYSIVRCQTLTVNGTQYLTQ